jgi:hypothetical protein
MDRWETFAIPLGGGVVQNMPPLEQANNLPGSLTRGVNFETSREGGGYRRVSGYAKYDNNEVPNTGQLLGTFVFDGEVIACRGDGIYESGGSGWTQLNSGDLNTGAEKYWGHRYNWGVESIILADKVNKPFKYDGSTLTRLTDAPSGVSVVQAFKRHMFMANGNLLTFSAPNDETNFAAADGAGEINVGFDIIGLGLWRDQLYVFGRNQIAKILGNNSSDFVLTPVTSRIGIVHRDTLQELSGDLVFLADDGVRTIAGTERIGDVEMGSISDPVYKSMYKLAKQFASGTFSSCIVAEKGQYRLFPVLGTEELTNTIGYVGCMDLTTQGQTYEWFELQGFQAVCADADYFDSLEIVVHGGFDGFVYQQEQGNSLGQENIVAYMELPYITYGDPRIRKTLYKVTAYANIEGIVSIIANVLFDYNSPQTLQPAETPLTSNTTTFQAFGTATFGGDEFGADPDITATINVVGSGLTNTIVISSNDQLAAYSVEEIVFEYGISGRR